MQSDADARDDKIQSYVERLYEDERLTDNLADRSAGTLLKWGEAQLKALSELNLDEAALDGAARQLRSIMRSINNLAGQHMDLSEDELVDGLIELVKQTLQYRDTLSMPPKEPAHGEETHNISDNNLAGQHVDLSENELVEGLIDLAQETLQYGDTLSMPPKEPAHGEETHNISDSETQEK